MSVFTRVVASLIATFFLFLGSSQVQAQVWGPQDLTTMREYGIQQIQVPFGSTNIAVNHKVAVVDTSMTDLLGTTMTEAAMLDELYHRCVTLGHQNCTRDSFLPTGKSWTVFKTGVPGTVPVTRFYIPSINSHVFVAANEMAGSESMLTLLRRYPDVYRDEGEKFGVMVPFAGFAEGKLPLPQACGDEKQSGLTAMLRIYNGGFSKPTEPETTPLAVRFNDGNHQFTTRNDAAYMAELKRVPGWEIAKRDMDSTSRLAGVWCVPSMTANLIQTTAFSAVPGDGGNGQWIQAQVHDLSRFVLNGSQITLQSGYEPTIYRTATNLDQTLTGRFDADSNRGVFALTRANGGYVEYGGQVVQTIQTSVLPKSTLNVDRNWSAIKIDQETGVVYATSVTDTIKFHAFDPLSNTYLWQYTVPEAYRQYNGTEGELHLAGNYLVTYLQGFTDARDNFKGALVVIPLVLEAGATPVVRIVDLPGPNNNPAGFTYNVATRVGTFADARARQLVHLSFIDWTMTKEDVPFEPYAVLVSNVSGEMYATHVPRASDMSYIPTNGALWKRSLSGGAWAQVSEVDRLAANLSVVNIAGVPKVMVFNRGGNSTTFQTIDFIDLKTGAKAPDFAEQLFGSMNLQDGLAPVSKRE